MTTLEITERVQQIVAGVARRADPAAVPIDGDIYRDLGVKSTAALDLLLSLEEAFGVRIPDEDFGDARTIHGLAALIGGLR